MDILDALTEARDAGRRAVLVTVVSVQGAAPSYAGAKVAVVGGGIVAGTLGCSEFDAAGLELAGELAGPGAQGATLRRRVLHGHDEAVELFAEVHEPAPRVLVCGANPISRAIAELAGFLGRISVELHDDAIEVIQAFPPGPVDALVMADHDAPYVDDVLRIALAGPACFVGMLGSRKHAPEMKAHLIEAGVPREQVEKLHSPCGLDIGSRGPAEIALSILGEIVAVERGRSGSTMALPAP